MGKGAGWQHCLHMKAESTLGTAPLQTGALWIPCETYDLQPADIFYEPQTFTCSRQRFAENEIAGKQLAGPLNCDFFGWQDSGNKSIAQHLMELILPSSMTTLAPNSKTFWWADANDPKQHVGVCGVSVTISGSADGPVKMAFQLEGMGETTTSPPTKTATTPHYKPAMFRDCTFALAGSAVKLRQFSLTIVAGIIPVRENSLYPTDMVLGGMRMINYDFQFYKTANTYDAMRRATSVSNFTGQLVIKADHMGTGATDTYTTLTVDFDKLNQNAIRDIVAREALDEQSVNTLAIKPATTDNDADFTWGVA